MRKRSFAFLLVSLIAIVVFAERVGAVELELLSGWTNAPFATSKADAFIDDDMVHFKGAVSSGTSALLFTLPPAMRPATDVYVAIDLCAAAPGRLYIQPSGNVSVHSSTTFADAQCFTSLDGAMFAPAATAFAALTPLNGWVGAFGTSSPAASLSNGIVRLKGAVSGGTSAILFTLPLSLRPATDVFLPVGLCSAVKGRLRIQPSGTVSVQASTTFADAQCFTSLDGLSFAPSASGFAAVTLLNGWVNTAFGTSDAAVAMINGVVHFKGAVSGGASSLIFTLPPAMRPATDVYVAVDLCNGAAGRLFIQPSGNVHAQGQSGFIDAQCFTSLDGATFVAPAPIGFTDLTLLGSWATYPGAQTPQLAIIDGVVYLKGAVGGGSTDLVFILPITMRPSADVYVAVDLCNAVPGRLYLQPNGAVRVQSSTAFADAQCFTSLESATFAPSPTGSTAVSLVNGWVGAPATSTPSASLINGVVHFRGAISSGTSYFAFTIPPAMFLGTNVLMPVSLCNALKGGLHMDAGGVDVSGEGGTLSDAQCFTSLDGAKFAHSTAGFTELTLVNGWGAPPFSSRSAAVKLINGNVHFKGAIANGTSSHAFTLPIAMRPEGTAWVPVDLCAARKGRLVISPNGDVDVEAQGPFSDAQCYTSLDGAVLPEPGGLPVLVSGLLLLVWLRGSKARGKRSVASAGRRPRCSDN